MCSRAKIFTRNGSEGRLKASRAKILSRNGRKASFREVVQKYSCPATHRGRIPVKKYYPGWCRNINFKINIHPWWVSQWVNQYCFQISKIANASTELASMFFPQSSRVSILDLQSIFLCRAASIAAWRLSNHRRCGLLLQCSLQLLPFPCSPTLFPSLPHFLSSRSFSAPKHQKLFFLQEAYAPPSDKEALQYLRKYGYLSGLKFLAIRSSVTQIVVQDLWRLPNDLTDSGWLVNFAAINMASIKLYILHSADVAASPGSGGSTSQPQQVGVGSRWIFEPSGAGIWRPGGGCSPSSKVCQHFFITLSQTQNS